MPLPAVVTLVALACLAGVRPGPQISQPRRPPTPEEQPSREPTHPTPLARAILASSPLDGVTLGLYSQDPSFDYSPLLQEIQALGSDWVSLNVNHYQHRYDSTLVGIADPRSCEWQRTRTTIRQARQLGLRVLMFPIVLMQESGDYWRGTLAPADRNLWFVSYRRLILRTARMCEEEGVEVLSIGSEFNSLQGEKEIWQALIRDIRAAYSGALTYSANWDSIDGVSFIDDVDLIGMTTYFSLSEENDPSVDTLVKAWRDLRRDVAEWRSFHGIPLLFTEVGYPSQDGANTNPWNYFLSTKVDVAEQRDCFEAFYQVWHDATGVDGVFYYNWFDRGGPTDTGYTPRGKPAAEILRRWFATPRRPDPPGPRKP